MSTVDYDYIFKIILIGDSGVGKSSLMLRFTDDAYITDHISTIGVDFKIRTMDMDGKHVKIQIWDTAGQERFRTITSSYYRGINAAMIVYDITRRDSFNNVKLWVSEIQKFVSTETPIMLIGNKSDLDKRVISTAEAQELANAHGLLFIETSTKKATNVTPAFETLCQELLTRQNDFIKRGLKPPFNFGTRSNPIHQLKKEEKTIGCCSTS
jgi:Ras-related protein Rab-1A